MFFTLGFKQKQFIYSSIENFHKSVPKDDTRSTTKVVVTLSLVFLDQSCYVKMLSILVQQRSSISEPTLNWNLRWNYHPNRYMEYEKNKTQLDNTNKTMIKNNYS